MNTEKEAAKKVIAHYTGTINHLAYEVFHGTATLSAIKAIKELADVIGTGDLVALTAKEAAVMNADRK